MNSRCLSADEKIFEPLADYIVADDPNSIPEFRGNYSTYCQLSPIDNDCQSVHCVFVIKGLIFLFSDFWIKINEINKILKKFQANSSACQVSNVISWSKNSRRISAIKVGI